MGSSVSEIIVDSFAGGGGASTGIGGRQSRPMPKTNGGSSMIQFLGFIECSEQPEWQIENASRQNWARAQWDARGGWNERNHR